jgi:histidinol-phosphate aminotransferase
MKSKNNLFKNIQWADKIYRVRGPVVSRLDKVRLDKNEKPDLHMSYLMKKIKKNLKDEHLTAYPETENLYNLISKKLRISKNSIVLTPGSDAAIKMCLDLMTEKNDKIITLNPTFAMVDIYAKIKRLKQIKVSYDDNLNLDLKKLFASIQNSKSKLLIIANPNSPTGTVISNKIMLKILNLCRRKNIFVLIDEAYYGFYKITALSYLRKFENLIICRTFSKAYGLAGCRVGFLISNPKISKKLYNLRPMYEVNSLGVMIANEILKDNKYFNKNLNDQLSGKKYFLNELRKLKINYLDGYANFVYVDFQKKKRIAEKIFFKNKILIKGNLKSKKYQNFLRVSLGPKHIMKKVLKIIIKLK